MKNRTRTFRSIAIEAVLRNGATLEEAIAVVNPIATRQEVYRVRRDYCSDVKFERRKRPTGDAHKRVVDRIQSGPKGESLSDVARFCKVSRARVGQIIANAKKRGELSDE